MLGSSVLCSKLLIFPFFCLCSLPEGQSLKNSILYFDERKTFLEMLRVIYLLQTEWSPL